MSIVDEILYKHFGITATKAQLADIERAVLAEQESVDSAPAPVQQAVPDTYKEAAEAALLFANDPDLPHQNPLTAIAHIKGLANLILSAVPEQEESE